MENNKLTHGLLIESFKQSLIDLINKNPLDIQTKAIILDYLNINVQKMSEQQTQKELNEYNAEQERILQKEKDKTETQNEASK